jgi:hypothetical protein
VVKQRVSNGGHVGRLVEGRLYRKARGACSKSSGQNRVVEFEWSNSNGRSQVVKYWSYKVYAVYMSPRTLVTGPGVCVCAGARARARMFMPCMQHYHALCCETLYAANIYA